MSGRSGAGPMEHVNLCYVYRCGVLAVAVLKSYAILYTEADSRTALYSHNKMLSYRRETALQGAL